MCGISGFIASEKHIVDTDVSTKVSRMSDGLFHRGPDHGGLFQNEQICFAHRRLSIVDLSDLSNQPMTDDKNEVVIVFNGEIYNSAEIREELEKEYDFKTDHSDTETVLYAYKKWGIKCLEKFTGMWALAIFDKNLETTFLIRDRLGKKPLYYVQDDQGVYFSSEVQPFFEAEVLEKNIRYESIYHYLSLLTVPAPNTFYEEVYKVEMGSYLKISNAGIEKFSYWDISDYINKEIHISDEEAVSEFERKLKKSMVLRNVSDVPVTIALSGGLDSSLNLHFSKELSGGKMNAINIAYEKTSEFDESVSAKKLASDLDIGFTGLKISDKDFQDWLSEYIMIQKDAPCGDINTSMVYGLSKLSRKKGGIVMLVGEGGDELGGYPVYAQLNKYHKVFRAVPNLIWKVLGQVSKRIRDEFEIYSYANDYSIRRFVFGFKEHEKNKFWNASTGKSNSYRVLQDISNEVSNDFDDAFYRKILNVEYNLRLSELILPRIDYPSMAASIEARAPFMDHDLIEFTSQLPFSQKMAKGPKSLIKMIAAKYLPQYIIHAPKVGFGQLLRPFFASTLPKWYESEILNTDSPIRKFIKHEALKEVYETQDYSYRMWLLYSLNKWLVVNSDAKNI